MLVRSHAVEKPYEGPLPYPCLMRLAKSKSKDSTRPFIVLFDMFRCGTVVCTNPEDGWRIGDHHSCWDETQFVRFHGTVTISTSDED